MKRYINFLKFLKRSATRRKNNFVSFTYYYFLLIQEESKPFVLAPTPAQLGKAPLQRRQSQGNCLPLSFTPVIGSHLAEKKEDVSESESPTKEDDEPAQMEVQQEDTTAVDNEPQTPKEQTQLTIKVDFAPDEGDEGMECPSQLTPTPKSFFKKNVEDGMDK